MPEGYKIVLQEQGDSSLEFRIPNIVYRVRTVPHKKFQRKGDDLHVSLEISLEDALLGFQKTITHLDGHEVDV